MTLRESVAGVIIDLISMYPKEMEPLLDKLLTSPTPAVRLLLLKRLDEIKLTESIIQKVILSESLDGPDWRVRDEVANHMAYLLKATNGTEMQLRLLDIVSCRV